MPTHGGGIELVSVCQPPQWVTADLAGLDWKPALHPIVIYPPSNVEASYAKRSIWRHFDEGLELDEGWQVLTHIQVVVGYGLGDGWLTRKWQLDVGWRGVNLHPNGSCPTCKC